jgi:hypothetical protein
MNLIQKHEFGYSAGQFVLHRHCGTKICHLGETIEVRLRTLHRDHKVYSDIRCLDFRVEIVNSLIHSGDIFSPNSLADLRVLEGNDLQIVMNVFNKDAFGQVHRLSLQPYEIRDQHGFVLVINGLLWDDGVLHVKDIVL